jgi:hypothetical protein
VIVTEKSLFLSSILITVASLLIFFILFLSAVWSYTLFYSVLAGELLVILNFIIGFMFIKLSLSKSDRIFLILLWGGMALRLILVLILVLILLKFLELNAIGFIFSILFFYVFYLIIEILYLNFKKIEHFER